MSAFLHAEAELGLGDGPETVSLSLLAPGCQSPDPLFTATWITEKVHILVWFGGPVWASTEFYPLVLAVRLRCAPIRGPGLAEIIFAAREFIICNIWRVIFSSFPSFFCIFPHPLPLTVGCPPSTFSPLGTYIKRQISVGSARATIALFASCFLLIIIFSHYCSFMLTDYTLNKSQGYRYWARKRNLHVLTAIGWAGDRAAW